MATILDVTLPGGWRSLNVVPTANITRTGRPGRWDLQDNDPFFVYTLTLAYLRSDFEQQSHLRFDDVYNFFLVTKGFGFLVDDVFDNTAEAREGEGVIVNVNGAWRLFKRYTSLGLSYEHPITRPCEDVVVSAGTLDPDTGIVTGITEEGTWTGHFKRPMIWAANGLGISRDHTGRVEAINVVLEEQLEI